MDNEFLKWLSKHPYHFTVMVIGICVCCTCVASCAVMITKYEYAYKTERDKSFWSKTQRAE